ncbi:guanine nucleotide-binding protein g(o) subunit alpha [Anaeramoeba flamelloides]|uniref:Guanine nucleotide-binding protein g(O) subunit alpha n=1 Tax=Anaeramoeba flamelloides TaxID=1746091 RepID=A0AAV7YJ30_9EUKA|nr:guanine nucleotide-binding protein g(o) subunit alpha [Anaeramoeba flamelloides]
MGNKRSKKDRKKRKIETKKNLSIEKQLKFEQNQEDIELKMLLLGTGDSGKSTFVKQMKICYSGGFSTSEKNLYTCVIQINCLNYTKELLRSMNVLDLNLSKEKAEDKKIFFKLIQASPRKISPKIADSIKSLWEDPSMKECFKHRNKFQLPASTGYFLDKIHQIADKNYKPNKTDILNCRIPTTGVKELSIEIQGYTWKLVDVGGQRSERRKWVHHFDDVDLLIFVIALDGYSQKLFENNNINRMHESLEVFDQITNNDYFKKKDLVILFNKIDIFEQKIAKVPIKNTFPEYKGQDNYEEGKVFFKQKFLNSIKKSNKRSISTYFTCGTETNTMKSVFENMRKTLIQKYINSIF